MKSFWNNKLYLIIFILSFAFNIYSQDGSMDQSFGTDGWVFASIEERKSGGSDVVVQPDGKIIVIGTYNNGDNDDFIVTRYNENGTIDQTFGTNGVTIISVGPAFDVAISVALQEDGKIIVAGYVNGIDSNDFGIARVNSDGTIDSTFGINGRVITPIGDQQDYLTAITIQRDGKIIAVGYPQGGDVNLYDAMIVRYLPNGDLDNSFGEDGIVTQDYNGGADSFYDVIVQRDGKIIAVGYTNNKVSFRTEMLIVRYNTDGSLDTTFGDTGMVTKQVPLTPGAFASTIGYAVSEQEDGKILIAGDSYPRIVVVRYNSDGTLDATFGTDGIVITAGKDSLDQATPNTILQQENGQFIITGHSYLGGKRMATALRYNNNGSLDLTFGDGGFAFAKTDGGYFYGAKSEMQNDGKILIAGRDLVAGVGRIGIVRINNTGAPLTDVEVDGKMHVNEFELYQNYPNPFNPSTLISYEVKDTKFVSLKVYNSIGQKVATLVNHEQNPGRYSVEFNASNLSSGIYFYSIRVEGFSSVKKMMLIK